jgi:hypothetical protein
MEYGKRPSRRRTTKRAKTGGPERGVRVQLQGLRTTRELRAMLHETVDQLEALGITHARGCNFYFTPADKKGKHLTSIGGAAIPDIEIKEPYRSAADEYDA